MFYIIFKVHVCAQDVDIILTFCCRKRCEDIQIHRKKAVQRRHIIKRKKSSSNIRVCSLVASKLL